MFNTAQLPADPTAEQNVLGACLLAPNAIPLAIELLPTADRFYLQSHGTIWQAVLDMTARGKEIDLTTLSSRLTDQGMLQAVGGNLYLADLLNSVATAANVEHYAGIVADKAQRRDLIFGAWAIDAAARDAERDLGLVLEESEQAIFRATQRPAERKLIAGGLQPTGILGLDEIIGGFSPGNLIVIGADTGRGKTALALDISLNFARRELPVLFISREMTASELIERIVASESGIDGNRLRHGIIFKSEWPILAQAIGKIDSLPLYLEDDANVDTVGMITGRARRLAKQLDYPLGLIVADYLQILEPDKFGRKAGSRAEEVGKMSRGLKKLACQMMCPVLALSQLNRPMGEIKNQRPTLARLRESGSIEQDANIVILQWTPDGEAKCPHGKKTDCPGGKDGPCPEAKDGNEAWVRDEVAKSRSTATGYADLYFARKTGRFETLATRRLRAARA